jgi:biopolymer transport protein ExbB/TolQ
MAAIVERIANSIWPTALGLFVGLPALWFHAYCRTQVKVFDTEMMNACTELVNRLGNPPATL